MIVKNTYFLKNEFYDRINNAFSNKNKREQLIRVIGSYVNKYSDVLNANGPTLRLYFQDENEKIFYTLTGISPNEIIQVIKKNKMTKDNWQLLNRSRLWIMVMSLSVMNNIDKSKERHYFNALLLYVACAIYASLHYRYFKFLPNENVMRYCINQLSNKFYIKKYKTINRAIFETALVSNNTYLNGLINASDFELCEYILGLRTRINNFLKNIRNEFEKTLQSKKYLNLDKDDNSEENFHEVDNDSFLIERLAGNATKKMLMFGVDHTLTKLAAQLTGTGQQSIQTAIENIVKNENHKDVNFVISVILQQYLVVNRNKKETIGSKLFISKCLELFAKSNTIDKNILKMKDILDQWLIKNSTKYLETNRVATKGAFKKAIFIYIVLTIQQTYIHH